MSSAPLKQLLALAPPILTCLILRNSPRRNEIAVCGRIDLQMENDRREHFSKFRFPSRMENDQVITPLHAALKTRSKEIARACINVDKKGSSYLILNKEGKSPLSLAVAAGYVDLVQLMIQNSGRSDENEKDIVDDAIKNKKMDVLEAILKRDQRKTMKG